MRRRRLALAAAGLAAALAGPVPTGPGGAPVAAQTGPPNVLVIVTDDQREDGTMQVLPFTRKVFERGGTRFTQAFATTPNCCPSRASIFTGRYAHNHLVKRNVIGDAPQLDQATTVQRYLREAGYRTGVYGKYLNNWDLSSPPPHFDDWAIFTLPNRYYDTDFNVNGIRQNVPGYSTHFITARARSFLRSSEADDARPWFLYLAPYAPHAPAIAEPAYRTLPVRALWPNPARDEYDRLDKPVYVQVRKASMRHTGDIRVRQLRSLRSVDDLVAAVFRALRELAEGNTLAFFASDNGFLWAEHGMIGKTLPYTESVKVPFYVRWPGRLPGGAVDDRLVANIDLAPTILEAAGLQPDPGRPMDGRSLFAGTRRDRIVLEYWPEEPGRPPVWASTRTPTSQYIEYYGYDGDGGDQQTFAEYYDLAGDPWQLHNALGDQDELNDPSVAGLSLRLSQDRRCTGSHCP